MERIRRVRSKGYYLDGLARVLEIEELSANSNRVQSASTVSSVRTPNLLLTNSPAGDGVVDVLVPTLLFTIE